MLSTTKFVLLVSSIKAGAFDGYLLAHAGTLGYVSLYNRDMHLL